MNSRRKEVTFQSKNQTLSGLLETPASGAFAYALFAHCFTCGKDIAAASRIARSLVEKGIAVLRFDFTGLGNSDGDFSNTNFSSNVDDLVAAAGFLRENYIAPAILIGHSLGGAAVLNAAHRVAECKAVVTIGAPADATHVAHQFSCDIPTIKREGQAEVKLAGRPFTIKKQFLDDIEKTDTRHIGKLKRALLILHSPVDTVVSIEQAEKIYLAAKHPKSFISLDNADHLLTSKDDAEYVATNISAWVTKYLPELKVIKDSTHEGDKSKAGIESGHVYINERNLAFTREVLSDSHFWLADEPVNFGGDNLGPDPYEHLLAALGTCTSMTIRMYANRKKMPLEHVTVELSHQKQHGFDCKECDDSHKQLEVLHRKISFIGQLTEDDRERLLKIADKCPVHRTLEGTLKITTEEV